MSHQNCARQHIFSRRVRPQQGRGLREREGKRAREGGAGGALVGCCTPCIRVGAAAEQWRGAVEEQRRSSGGAPPDSVLSLMFLQRIVVSSHNTEHRVCIGWQRKDKAGGMFWPGKLWRHVDAPQPFKFSFKWTANRILPETILKKKSRAATHIEEES